MKIRLTQGGPLYIRADIETARGTKTLRRWPWPHSEHQRQKHLNEAIEYCNGIAAILLCPFDIETGQRAEAA